MLVIPFLGDQGLEKSKGWSVLLSERIQQMS